MNAHLYAKHRANQSRADPITKVEDGSLQCRFRISKADADNHLIFGWASIAARADGEVIQDYQDDIIEIDELERAVYEYVLLYRDGGEMHVRGGVAQLVESMVFTKQKMTALNIPDGTLPEGWWIGLYVTDDDVWAKIKDGTYTMFSIEGTAVREKVDDQE